MENAQNIKAMFIVLNAGFAEDIIETAREAGVIGATIIHARGAGAPKAFMGITVDAEKEIIFSITSDEVAARAMEKIKEKHGINTPARAICFLMPVDKTVGISAASEPPEEKKR